MASSSPLSSSSDKTGSDAPAPSSPSPDRSSEASGADASSGGSLSAELEIEDLPYAGFSGVEAVIIAGGFVLLSAFQLVGAMTSPCCGIGWGSELFRQSVATTSLLLPWALCTVPTFWACARLRPEKMGWGPAVAGHLGLALVVMFAATWAHNGIHYGLYALWPDEHSLQYTTLSAWTLLTEFRFLGDLLPYALLLLVGFGRYNYLRSEARRARAKQLQAELTAARLASLRMQINPHFLYNTLHTISTMAGRNPDGIRQASARLSDLMRYALSTSDQQEVPLTDELDVLQSYLDIQKLRLEERLEVTLDVNPETRPALVPTLLLQPLAENAVKHGFEGRDCTGHLVVRARRDEDRLVLVVADDGRGLSGSSHLASGNGAAHDGEHQAASRSNGTGADPGAGPSRDMGHDQHDQGTGLQNITRRLNGLYGDAAELDLESPAGGGLRVVIQLPFHVRTADADLRADGVVAS